MTHAAAGFGPIHAFTPGRSGAQICLVCEHASARIPESLNQLGLDDAAACAHIAWDPGALGVARALAAGLGAPLVNATISRLVYDLNRPPESPDAMRDRSEVYAIPGNRDLSPQARKARTDHIYHPFHDAVSRMIADLPQARALVTVHSFTPVYEGRTRAVELGILHGRNPALAEAMMATMPADFPFRTELNQPYSAADGVAHTLDKHTLDNHGQVAGLDGVMLEIRNDLIATEDQQQTWADLLSGWLTASVAALSKGATP